MRSSLFRRSVQFALGLCAGAATLSARDVAVHGQVYNGYHRETLPDGTVKPELYAFGEGGCWSSALKDPWMDQLKFTDVASAVAGPLAKANFRPALKTADAQLLILVFWGSTQGSNDIDQNDLRERASKAVANYDNAQDPNAKSAQRGLDRTAVNARTPEGAAYENMLWQLGVGNRMRDALDEQNARILGYAEALDRARFAQNSILRNDLLDELGGNRYYVVLQAFDFHSALKEKKLRPLWTTRLSVSEDGEFGAALNTMVWSGHPHFGRFTDGLKRERAVQVDVPPVRFTGLTPPPATK